MRGLAHILALLVAASTLVAAEEPAPAPADAAERDHYARWDGTSKAELLEFWGQPHKTKRKGDGSKVLIYEIRVTCDGIITGTQYTRLGKGVVTSSQDPLDSIENNVPQGATRRAGSRVAARQTVRFFVDATGTVARHEATATKTNWKRCKF